jgi:prepilin-type N-terminal cleavage/methylation domain-containing protein
MIPSSHQKGLTLVEIILVTAISSIIIAALLRFLTAGFPLSKVTYLQERSTENARLQLQRLARTIREARQSDTGAYPLVETSPQRLIFYADVDGDPLTERVRYELTGTNLVRGILKPTGTPLTYNLANEVTTTIASYLRNGATPLFIYYSGDYPTDSTALASTDIAKVKYIQFHVIIDADPAVDPPATDVLSQVQLRNLKTNLSQEVPTPTPGASPTPSPTGTPTPTPSPSSTPSPSGTPTPSPSPTH